MLNSRYLPRPKQIQHFQTAQPGYKPIKISEKKAPDVPIYNYHHYNNYTQQLSKTHLLLSWRLSA